MGGEKILNGITGSQTGLGWAIPILSSIPHTRGAPSLQSTLWPLLWTCSNRSTSFLWWGPQRWTQQCRWCPQGFKPAAEYIDSGFLHQSGQLWTFNLYFPISIFLLLCICLELALISSEKEYLTSTLYSMSRLCYLPHFIYQMKTNMVLRRAKS